MVEYSDNALANIQFPVFLQLFWCRLRFGAIYPDRLIDLRGGYGQQS